MTKLSRISRGGGDNYGLYPVGPTIKSTGHIEIEDKNEILIYYHQTYDAKILSLKH